MTSKRLLTFFIFSFSFSILLSQDIKKGPVYDYARKIVDTMASENMHGRGYVNGGDGIAAAYLKAEYQKIGLNYFNNDFFQPFEFSINTFPDSIFVEIDDKKLTPGKDYIIYSHSPTSAGSYELLTADDRLVRNKKKYARFLKQDFTNKVVIVNDTGAQTAELKKVSENSIHAKAIILLKDKLTASMSREVDDYPVIEVLRASINKKPENVNFYIRNEFIPNYISRNVIGYIKGSEYPDSFIVFSAHYDHLGRMGKDIYFPGANDNASGCAMLLSLAQHYSIPENKPKYSIAFIAFAAEEVGLLGSKYYTEHPYFPLKNIKFLLNMDIMGTGEDGITVVNGTLFKDEFEKLKQINIENEFIKEVRIRGKSANSDHYFFSENGVKAFFIYTLGGIKAYHDIYDRPETLPLNEFEDLIRLITKFGDYLNNQ